MCRHAERGACLLQQRGGLSYSEKRKPPSSSSPEEERESVAEDSYATKRENEGAFFGKRRFPTEPAHYFPLPKHIGSCHAPTTQGGGRKIHIAASAPHLHGSIKGPHVRHSQVYFTLGERPLWRVP